MLRILWLGNLTKVVLLFLVYAKLFTLRRRGSPMLRLGLSFWKQIHDKWLRWFHGSLTHRFCHSLGEETRNLDFMSACLFSSPRGSPSLSNLLSDVQENMLWRWPWWLADQKKPQGNPRQVPASPRNPQVFQWTWPWSFLPLLNKNIFYH